LQQLPLGNALKKRQYSTGPTARSSAAAGEKKQQKVFGNQAVKTIQSIKNNIQAVEKTKINRLKNKY